MYAIRKIVDTFHFTVKTITKLWIKQTFLEYVLQENINST